MITNKNLSRKIAIRIAELAFGHKINNAVIYFEPEEKILYIFIDHTDGLLTQDYIKEFGIDRICHKYNYVYIDGSFNITLKENYMLNMAVIYKIIFDLGFVPSLGGTGLFPASKFEPADITQVVNQPSENLYDVIETGIKGTNATITQSGVNPNYDANNTINFKSKK